MRIYKTSLFISDDTKGKIYKMDIIEYESKFWLVPEWLDSPKTGLSKPARIILLDNLPHQKMIGNSRADFVLNNGIPKAVLDGIQPSNAEYTVVLFPDIQIQFQGGLH